MTSVFQAPIRRTRIRKTIGRWAFSLLRQMFWFQHRSRYQLDQSVKDLPYLLFTHRTPLNRPLKDVDAYLQENKRHNIALAIAHLDGVVVNPGRTFSYWNCIGNPTKRKGYLPGMVLDQGTFKAGIGGGLCQLSNLLYWMTLHTPLTVTERWRHGYDVFPDVRRTQPFGSGATCFYPFLDLAVKNETSQRFQLRVFIDGDFLVGEWRSDQMSTKTYSIEERDHRIVQAPWGGYIRMNTIVRRVYELGAFLKEEIVAKNEAVMMYNPLLASPEDR